MDELIDQILSSSSWVDMSAVNRSSLNTGDRRPANCMPGDSVGALQGSSRVATMSIVPSSCLSGNSGGQGQNKDAQNGSSNVIADQNTPFLSKKPLIGSQVRKDPIIASPVPGQSQHDSMSTMDVNSRAQANQESAHISLQKQVENNTASGSIGLQLNSDGSASPHGVSSQVSPAVGGATTVAVALPGSASGRTSGNEALGIHRHRGGTHSPVPTESLWCQSYMAGVSPIPSVLAQGKSEAFVLHGETTQGEGHFLGKRCRLEEESQERENRSATTGLDGFRGNPLPSYIGTQAGPTPSNITGGTQPPEQNPGVQMLQSSHGNSLQQHVNQSVISQPQSAATAGAATNGAARPRVRARRGQATDPHSIAERLRRERIAERMKALQELVPNSNKTDKASMLDEIIEYVKFLQLQVKVLSMSRLGGTGAVAPLIADVPSEGSGLVSAALAQASSSLSQSEDGLAFEQKVAKLMESNMTTAMQYLQNKGLCLMPIALATAISSSSGKPLLGAGSMKSVDSACDRKNSDTQPVALTASSCSAAVTIGASGFGSDALLKENLVKKEMREEVAIPTKGAQSWN